MKSFHTGKKEVVPQKAMPKKRVKAKECYHGPVDWRQAERIYHEQGGRLDRWDLQKMWTGIHSLFS